MHKNTRFVETWTINYYKRDTLMLRLRTSPEKSTNNSAWTRSSLSCIDKDVFEVLADQYHLRSERNVVA